MCFVGSRNSLQKSREIIETNTSVLVSSNNFQGIAGQPRNRSGYGSHRMPVVASNPGNTHHEVENMSEGMNKNEPERKFNLNDIAYQRIQHQMQSNFEIRINAIKKANNEALSKGEIKNFTR